MIDSWPMVDGYCFVGFSVRKIHFCFPELGCWVRCTWQEIFNGGTS